MSSEKGFIGRVMGWIHHHFLWLLVGAYALAACWPLPGTALRHASVAIFNPELIVSLPMLLLAGLLFCAGLAVDATELMGLVRKPRAVLCGAIATVAVPLLFLTALTAILSAWPDAEEAHCLLIGLGVVAAMPVAGSSAAWSQNAGGSAALSLGLVVVSTLFSPLTTPLTLAAVLPMVGAGGRSSMAGLSGPGTMLLLSLGVALPSVAGMVVRSLVGSRFLARALPILKSYNSTAVLVLCYANASASLPAIAAEPDWDYLMLVVLAAAALCGTGFAAGWGLARLLGVGRSQRRSLVFGLGMSNNGTGLVVAGAALAALPAAVVPVLTYNLLQHLVAAAVNRSMGRES